MKNPSSKERIEKLKKERHRLMIKFAAMMNELESGKYDAAIRKACKK